MEVRCKFDVILLTIVTGMDLSLVATIFMLLQILILLFIVYLTISELVFHYYAKWTLKGALQREISVQSLNESKNPSSSESVSEISMSLSQVRTQPIRQLQYMLRTSNHSVANYAVIAINIRHWANVSICAFIISAIIYQHYLRKPQMWKNAELSCTLSATFYNICVGLAWSVSQTFSTIRVYSFVSNRKLSKYLNNLNVKHVKILTYVAIVLSMINMVNSFSLGLTAWLIFKPDESGVCRIDTSEEPTRMLATIIYAVIPGVSMFFGYGISIITFAIILKEIQSSTVIDNNTLVIKTSSSSFLIGAAELLNKSIITENFHRKKPRQISTASL